MADAVLARAVVRAASLGERRFVTLGSAAGYWATITRTHHGIKAATRGPAQRGAGPWAVAVRRLTGGVVSG